MIGSAIFQNKHYDPIGLNPGFKCVSGEEAVKFEGTGELQSNVRWLTNITVESAFNSQLKNTPRLLDDKYLRVSTSSMILELGLKSCSLEEQAKCVAHIFNNTMRLASRYFRLDEPPKGSLAAGIPAPIGHVQPKISDPTILGAAQQSILQFTACERRLPGAERVEYVSLIIPRVKHANAVISAGAPWDDFFWLSPNQLPPANQRLKWIVESPLPMLCKVRILSIDREMNHLVNWGNGAGSFSKRTITNAAFVTTNQRQYVTSNELKVLAQFCRIEVDEVAISNTPPETNYSLPDGGPICDLSYSYGLIVENLWCALLRGADGTYLRTPMTAWIHATDRMYCLQHAKHLSTRGFTVNGYGYGRITLAVELSRKEELKRVALEMGLLPSLEVDILEENLDVSSCSSNDELMKLLFSCGHLPFILQLDDEHVKYSEGSKDEH